MNTPTLLWETPAWRAEAMDWMRSRVSSDGITLTGKIEQPYVRPWSTVMSLPTDQGLLYFKASADYLAHEAAITEYLTNFRPELFPRLLAVDAPRNWMLMEDAGVPLRQFVRKEKSFSRWNEIMPLFSSLQQDVAPQADDLLALGMPDRRLKELPALFEDLIGNEPAMMIDQEESLTADQYEALKRSLPEFSSLCKKLEESGISETIHHDDFHDANIFIKDGKTNFTDWAESAISHPFLSLVVMLRGAGNSLETWSQEGFEAGPDTPEIAQLREIYLKNWASYGSMDELLSMARIAERKIGYVNRALTWHHVIIHMPEELSHEYAIAVPIYMQEFLNS